MDLHGGTDADVLAKNSTSTRCGNATDSAGSVETGYGLRSLWWEVRTRLLRWIVLRLGDLRFDGFHHLELAGMGCNRYRGLRAVLHGLNHETRYSDDQTETAEAAYGRLKDECLA